MARLPTPGSDDGDWGTILNDYLAQSHNDDGTLSDNAVASAQIADDAVDSAQIADGAISDAQVSDTAEIAQSKIADLGTDLSSLETDVTTVQASVDNLMVIPDGGAQAVVGGGVNLSFTNDGDGIFTGGSAVTIGLSSAAAGSASWFEVDATNDKIRFTTPGVYNFHVRGDVSFALGSTGAAGSQVLTSAIALRFSGDTHSSTNWRTIFPYTARNMNNENSPPSLMKMVWSGTVSVYDSYPTFTHFNAFSTSEWVTPSFTALDGIFTGGTFPTQVLVNNTRLEFTKTGITYA